MKNIENYVCTLKQSKRLRELNVEQDSLYYFIENKEEKYNTIINADQRINWLSKPIDFYSAFTSQELGEIITGLYDKYDPSIDINQSFFCDRVFCWKNGEECIEFEPTFTKEAQVRAEFLIYLLERKK